MGLQILKQKINYEIIMKKICYTLVLFIALSGITNAQAQFTLNEPAKVQKGTEGGTFYFTVNEELFSNPDFKEGAEFVFNTGRENRGFILTRKSEFIPGYISIIAADKETGENVLATTYHRGKLNGLFHRSHTEAKKIAFDSESGMNVLKKNVHQAGEVLACGVGGDEHLAQMNHSKKGSQKRTKTAGYSISPAAPLNTGLDDEITIDLLILYTNAAETWASTSNHGDINGVIAQAMNLSQQALDNSEANIELRLVHSYKTPYDETSDDAEDSDERLNRLTQNDADPIFEGTAYNGHMEEVHDLRDQYGADVVSMFARISDTGGLGWRLGSSGGNAYQAFNLNRVQQVADNYTLIHEIGHNMGNDHARTQLEAQASGGGGLFQYSVGFQNESEGFHTVMAYDETQNGTRLTEIPYFSSPDLSYQGNPLGTNDSVTPEHSALSMRQIKRTISYYRPTEVDAPAAEAGTDRVEVEMNREDQLTVPVSISNNGDSPLTWVADFSFPGNSVSKSKAGFDKKPGPFKPVESIAMTRQPANYSGLMQGKEFRTKMNEEIIYSTSFESSEGFSVNTFSGIEEWRALSDSEFEISSENSNSGNQHLRVTYNDGETVFIGSPFFGYRTLGTYEVSIDFSVSDTENEVYDFYLFDGKTGGYTSGVIIAGGSIYYFDADENGGVTNLGGRETINVDQYYNLRIVYNVNNESIDYYLDGTMVYEADYMQGYTPGVIQVLSRNNLAGSYMDVDDIEIKKVHAPYEWLQLPDMTGVIEPGSSSDIDLEFTTEGVEAGVYETILTVRTNQPENELIEVPVTLTVNQAVSNEKEDQPSSINLSQNYPTPFNPVTTISYSLDEAREVSLDVFNMQGQKVATVMEDQTMSAGEHSVSFDASALSSGVYMYRLRSASQTVTKQMVLIK